MLQALKFERAISSAAHISDAMAGILPHIPADTIIVPIPTATSRVRRRGYDQAVVISHNVADTTDLPMHTLLVRLTQSRQLGANRQHRLLQLASAYMVSTPSMVKGVSILLIDDVLTTGATLETAARCLRQAGAKSVSALVFAQKQ